MHELSTPPPPLPPPFDMNHCVLHRLIMQYFVPHLQFFSLQPYNPRPILAGLFNALAQTLGLGLGLNCAPPHISEQQPPLALLTWWSTALAGKTVLVFIFTPTFRDKAPSPLSQWLCTALAGEVCFRCVP